MNRPIQTAIIGYGKSAKIFHTPLLKASDKYEVTSVLQRTRDDAKKDFREVKIIRDLKDLLKDDTLELIIITTPNHFHFDQAFEALSADKHVIVEKPFTVSSDEAEKLIRLAESKNRVLTVFQNRRWDGDFQTIKKLIHEKAVGDIVEFESSFNRFRNYLRDDAWKEKDLPGSGILYDLAPHLIDQTIMLFGMPDRVFADIRSQRGGEADDCFEINFYYPGIKAKLRAGMLVPEETPRFVLRGKRGSFVKFGLDVQEEALANGENPLNDSWGTEPEKNWGTLYKEEGGEIISKKIETVPGNYAAFYDEVATSIRKKQPPPVLPDTAKKVIKLIELAKKSDQFGKVIDVV
ncbi:MAG: Gfo/Idh/MocA family oxidoreductase [Balneolaceae bacterium]|nr:Gfo/Idh/MocA family oxidoreductase [Balneolaceae bacterium]